jgi:hypothetical protein
MSASNDFEPLEKPSRGATVSILSFSAIVCRAMDERWFIATLDVIPFGGIFLFSVMRGECRVVFSIIDEPEDFEPRMSETDFSKSVVDAFDGYIHLKKGRPIIGSTVQASGWTGMAVEIKDTGDLIVATPEDVEVSLPISAYQGCVRIGDEHKMYVWRVSPILFRVCELPTMNSYRIAEFIASAPRDTRELPVVKP